MKKRWGIYLAILFTLSHLPACGQQQQQKPPYISPDKLDEMKREAAESDLQQQELFTLQKETVRALQLHNSSFFNRVYSDDYFGTTPTGAVQDKAKLIASIQTSNVNYSSFVVSDIRVRMYEHTAVVTCLWSSRGTVNGAAFYRQARIVNVYTNAGQGWKVVVSQETQLPG